MTNEELLVAMSDMMDEKLDPLKNEMSEVKERVTNIEDRVTNIEDQVANIEDRVTSIELDMENVVKPGVEELCAAYHTEYEKYRTVNEDYDRMTIKVDVMETVVSEHSEKIAEIQQVVGL